MAPLKIRRTLTMRLLTLQIAALCLSLGACRASTTGGEGGGARGSKARKPTEFPVQTSPVESRRVEYALQAVGSLAAFEEVQVTARVAGAVERVRFAEGDRVSPGATLAEIDPDRYRVSVEGARAALEKARAAAAEARASLARREALNARTPGLVRAEEVETWRTQARSAEADVASAEAALKLAELNLRDAFVRAPAGGVIETRTVQTGQYVQPGTVLATLVRRDPLLLEFDLPEREAAQVRVAMKAFFTVGSREREAAISHVAQAADPASRMVRVVARVAADEDPELRPGAFAEVRLPVGASDLATVIPQTAVRPSEKGFLAFVVSEGRASERILELGLRTADGLVEVRRGVAAGERLVIRGAEPLKDGARVRVEAEGARADAQKAQP
jgi:multidrug efflux system membrane fusion protein